MISRFIELDDFVPHLTLGKESYGGGISSGVTERRLERDEAGGSGELEAVSGI
ncbi:hypothetical protein [Bacillus sp. FJAT-27916]|uniref:hypothetical protein n=1 Tax=Bacillus sp. FJAT-27916 TaxID=1679169 RepID=UPI000A97015D|nr:hypothetical protein [Bacillus sp. FJAT-27916]